MTSSPDFKTSVGNSTETALGSAETFTGAWEVNAWDHAAVNAQADQDGTLYIDFGIKKDDGTVVTTFTRETSVYADVGSYQALVKVAGRAFRVRYVNGSVAQSSFVLHTAYGDNYLPSSASDDNEVLVTVTERERDNFVALDLSEVTSTTYAILIDLSDTTNFPHSRTGRIDLTNMYLFVERNSSAVGELQVGVITRIDGTDADISYVQGVGFNKSDTRTVVRDRKFSPSQMKLGVSGGALTRAVSNFTESSVTAVNTGVTLASPRGASTVTPAVGDVIVKAAQSAGAYDAAVSCFYHGERSA